jgi:PiT family inorganic phosphate transporter
MIFILLSSGLFLGWSLGANDAANIFGTAVGTKMVRFRVAAYTAGIFVILGAVLGGAGATHTLGQLGSVNALAGAFMVAFSAGLTVFLMTKYKLPVSTSQAIVGSIIGWNLYADMITDTSSLSKILLTWVLCPLLAAVIAMILYALTKWIRAHVRINIFAEDYRIRIGLIVIGAFGAYSLGANNIANVMGVFVSAKPFEPVNLFDLFTLSGAQILFLIGGIAVALGIITYSHKVMDTVGINIIKLSPVTAFIVVLAESIVLFVFSSQGLETWLLNHGLPPIPLVPVSSSQAVVGAVIGIGLIKNFRQIRFHVLGEIASGWVTTPVIAGLITFIFLFFLQNVFNQKVFNPQEYALSPEVITYLDKQDLANEAVKKLGGQTFGNESDFYTLILNAENDNKAATLKIMDAARINELWLNPLVLMSGLDTLWLSAGQVSALRNLSDRHFDHHWQIDKALQEQSETWVYKADEIKNRAFNKELKARYEYVYQLFAVIPAKK